MAAVICAFLLLGGCHYSRQSGSEWEEVNALEDSMPATSGILCEETIPSKSLIYVQVCGQVMNPGVYEVLEGTRMYEVLELAGGVTQDGRTDSLWLAREVKDGDKVYVPGEDELPGMTDAGDGLLDINTADVAGLMTLPGIGEARAGDIIAYRTQNGGFKTIEEIMNVPGIKEAAFNKIKDKIKVG